MPVPLTEEEKQLFENNTLYGEDPYDQKLTVNGFTALPHCMYFIYVGLDAAKLEDVKHYYHDNGPTPLTYADAETMVTKLAWNASLKDHVPPQHGFGFKNMIWRRRSYLAFVIDHPIYTTWPGKAIQFNSKNNALPNHTFFDGKSFEVDVKRPDGTMVRRSAFMCINHMKHASGMAWPTGATEKFSFALLLKMGNFEEPLEYDPGGTNQGPPVDP